MAIQVLLADDQPVVRAGICAILKEAPDIEVVGEAKDGAEAQRLTHKLRSDVLLLDLVMPGPRPSEVARWVRNHSPQTTTLVLTGHDRDAFLAEMGDGGSGRGGLPHRGIRVRIAPSWRNVIIESRDSRCPTSSA